MALWQTESTCINYSSGINSPKDGKQKNQEPQQGNTKGLVPTCHSHNERKCFLSKNLSDRFFNKTILINSCKYNNRKL